LHSHLHCNPLRTVLRHAPLRRTLPNAPLRCTLHAAAAALPHLYCNTVVTAVQCSTVCHYQASHVARPQVASRFVAELHHKNVPHRSAVQCSTVCHYQVSHVACPHVASRFAAELGQQNLLSLSSVYHCIGQHRLWLDNGPRASPNCSSDRSRTLIDLHLIVSYLHHRPWVNVMCY
jgi:hypothetical protein